MLRRALLVLVLVLAALVLPAATRAAVPRGWVGVMADGELLEQPKLLDPELGRMSSVGVSSLRATLRWNLTVRCAKCRPDFRRFDRIVLGTARRRISVLPVVLGAPAYLAENPDDEVALPRDAADLGAFLRLAVRRYGPDGVLWQQHPEVIPVPIRTWQVWNEPDHELYMPHTQNWPARYVELLKAAAQGIRAEDTGAKVMLAGFAGQAWIHVDWVYRNGARPWFDVAAVHPYTRDVADVVRIVRYMRDTMRRWGDARKPVALTELGWTGARGHTRLPSWCSFCLTEPQAASSLRKVLPLLARERRRLVISGVYVYTWISAYQHGLWDYAGLRVYRRGRVTSAPSYFAFLAALRSLR